VEKDTDFLHKVKLGDIEAFESVFKSYYAPLVGYGRTIVKDSDEAEDIVQQVFVSIWEKRTEMEVHTSLRGLLYRSVYNACLNRIKHNKIRMSYARETQLTNSSSFNQEDIRQKELQKKIDDAINSLPEQCGKIFKMSRFDEMKYQEIADKLGLSVKTVENQMGKALKIMRENLKDYLPILVALAIHFK
jgi:RNA polymerase sigma-70 factor (ECF subfamily)